MNNEASPALDPQQVAEALSFACEAATEAGTIALSYFRRALNVHNKLDDGRFDPVTQAEQGLCPGRFGIPACRTRPPHMSFFSDFFLTQSLLKTVG